MRVRTAVWVVLCAALPGAACVERTPGYCDERYPCEPGYVCDLAQRTCVRPPACDSDHPCDSGSCEGGGDGCGQLPPCDSDHPCDSGVVCDGGTDACAASPASLQVTIVAPADGATDVAADAALSVTFSESVDEASVTSDSWQLVRKGEPVAGTFEVAGAQASFTPAEVLVAGATYVAILTTGLRSASGAALAHEVRWSFTVIDHEPPQLVAIEPTDGTVAVEPTTAVTVRFSEDVDPLTITDNTVWLQADNGPGLPVPVERAVAGAVVTLKAVPQLALSGSYTVRVSTDVTDIAGNALTAAGQAQFAVRDGSWGAAGPVRVAGFDPGDTRRADGPFGLGTAIDTTGDVAVAWSQGKQLWLRRYDAASRQWVPAQQAHAFAANAQISEWLLASRDDHEVVLAWNETGAGISLLRARKAADGSWELGTPQLVYNGSDASQTLDLLALASDGAGRVVMLGSASRANANACGTDVDLWSLDVTDPADGLSSHQHVATYSRLQGAPQGRLVVARDGSAHALLTLEPQYYQTTPTPSCTTANRRVVAPHRDPGATTWQAPSDLTTCPANQDVRSPYLSLAPDGHAAAVWEHSQVDPDTGSTISHVEGATFTPNSGWQSVYAFDTPDSSWPAPGDGFATEPVAVAIGEGRARVAWSQLDGSRAHAMLGTLIDTLSGGWSRVYSHAPPPDGTITHAALAVAPSGAFTAAWAKQLTNSTPSILAKTWRRDGAAGPELATPVELPAAAVRALADPQGRFTLLWALVQLKDVAGQLQLTSAGIWAAHFD